MEVKKSKHADLERRRGWRLVFGLVVSLGMLLAVLEFSWKEEANPEMDLDTLKEIVEDLNVEEDRDRIPLLKEEEYEKSEKLVVLSRQGMLSPKTMTSRKRPLNLRN